MLHTVHMCTLQLKQRRQCCTTHIMHLLLKRHLFERIIHAKLQLVTFCSFLLHHLT